MTEWCPTVAGGSIEGSNGETTQCPGTITAALGGVDLDGKELATSQRVRQTTARQWAPTKWRTTSWRRRRQKGNLVTVAAISLARDVEEQDVAGAGAHALVPSAEYPAHEHHAPGP